MTDTDPLTKTKQNFPKGIERLAIKLGLLDFVDEFYLLDLLKVLPRLAVASIKGNRRKRSI